VTTAVVQLRPAAVSAIVPECLTILLPIVPLIIFSYALNENPAAANSWTAVPTPVTSAAGYGGDKGIFGFGSTGSNTGVTNLVNNSGVIGSDVSAVGTARNGVGAAGYSISA